jgi:hypothetical protein
VTKQRTYGGHTLADIDAAARAAKREIQDVDQGDAIFVYQDMMFPDTVLALLDDLARLRAAARAFCEERTEEALQAMMSEVER